jgi:hypothetical protein
VYRLSRPLAVTIIAWFLFAATVGGGAVVGVAAAALAAAIGLLRAKKWAWWMAVALFTIEGGGNVVSFIITRDVLRSGSGILICAAFLYLLQRSNRYVSRVG